MTIFFKKTLAGFVAGVFLFSNTFANAQEYANLAPWKATASPDFQKRFEAGCEAVAARYVNYYLAKLGGFDKLKKVREDWADYGNGRKPVVIASFPGLSAKFNVNTIIDLKIDSARPVIFVDPKYFWDEPLLFPVKKEAVAKHEEANFRIRGGSFGMPNNPQRTAVPSAIGAGGDLAPLGDFSMLDDRPMPSSAWNAHPAVSGLRFWQGPGASDVPSPSNGANADRYPGLTGAEAKVIDERIERLDREREALQITVVGMVSATIEMLSRYQGMMSCETITKSFEKTRRPILSKLRRMRRVMAERRFLTGNIRQCYIDRLDPSIDLELSSRFTDILIHAASKAGICGVTACECSREYEGSGEKVIYRYPALDFKGHRIAINIYFKKEADKITGRFIFYDPDTGSAAIRSVLNKYYLFAPHSDKGRQLTEFSEEFERLRTARMSAIVTKAACYRDDAVGLLYDDLDRLYNVDNMEETNRILTRMIGNLSAIEDAPIRRISSIDKKDFYAKLAALIDVRGWLDLSDGAVERLLERYDGRTAPRGIEIFTEKCINAPLPKEYVEFTKSRVRKDVKVLENYADAYEVVKEVIHMLGITVLELARRVGIGWRTLANVANGVGGLPQNALEVISEYAHAQAVALFTDIQKALNLDDTEYGKVVSPKNPISAVEVQNMKRGDMAIPTAVMIAARTAFEKSKHKIILGLIKQSKLTVKNFAEATGVKYSLVKAIKAKTASFSPEYVIKAREAVERLSRASSARAKLKFNMHVRSADTLTGQMIGSLNDLPEWARISFAVVQHGGSLGERRLYTVGELIKKAHELIAGSEIAIFVESDKLSRDVLDRMARHIADVAEAYEESGRREILPGSLERIGNLYRAYLNDLTTMGFDIEENRAKPRTDDAGAFVENSKTPSTPETAPAGRKRDAVTIKPLTIEYARDHLKEILELHNTIKVDIWEEGQLLTDEWKAGEFGRPNHRVFPGKWDHSYICEDSSGHPIGLLIGYEEAAGNRLGLNKVSLYFHALAVSYGYQNRGIAKRLFLRAVADINKSGFIYLKQDYAGPPLVSLQVEEENIRAQSIYQKLGFEWCATEELSDHKEYIYVSDSSKMLDNLTGRSVAEPKDIIISPHALTRLPNGDRLAEAVTGAVRTKQTVSAGGASVVVSGTERASGVKKNEIASPALDDDRGRDRNDERRTTNDATPAGLLMGLRDNPERMAAALSEKGIASSYAKASEDKPASDTERAIFETLVGAGVFEPATTAGNYRFTEMMRGAPVDGATQNAPRTMHNEQEYIQNLINVVTGAPADVNKPATGTLLGRKDIPAAELPMVKAALRLHVSDYAYRQIKESQVTEKVYTIKAWAGYAAPSQTNFLTKIRKITQDKQYRVSFNEIGELVSFACNNVNDDTVTILPLNMLDVDQVTALKNANAKVIYINLDGRNIGADDLVDLEGLIGTGKAYLADDEESFYKLYRLLAKEPVSDYVALSELKSNPFLFINRLKFILRPIDVKDPAELPRLKARQEYLLEFA
ncbi:MAG: N-acetyltransferase [Candidatus Omnitrophica bacterium]|nr:N-acetyltransferase [Candidatus Omnitrophota bacterium]